MFGVPLVTRNLKGSGCFSFVDKNTQRIPNYTTRFLSFSGTLKLIQSIIFILQSYWCRILVLPTKVIKNITQQCNSFLWKGEEGWEKGVRISWKGIFYPISKGGLGIKDMGLWNKICSMKINWKIVVKSTSLWVAWVERYLLKGGNLFSV